MFDAVAAEKRLKERWGDLTSFVTEDVRQKWWNRFVAAYKDRPFTGYRQLTRMFTEFDHHKDVLKDRYAFAFAVFFKKLAAPMDAAITYGTGQADNPEKSAELLREFCQDTTFDQENHVADLILGAGKGSCEANLTEGASGDDDLHYLIDFDLAFLGDDPSSFIESECAMRSEYRSITDADYAAMRLKTLKFFIQIPNIYITTALRDQYEQKARTNISNEIAALEAGTRKYE